MDDLLYRIAITKIPKVGPVTARNLISYCGGVEAVFEANKRELLRIPGIGAVTAKLILEQNVLAEAEKELKFIAANDIQTIFYLDEDYPIRLKPYTDAPILLFYKGTSPLQRRYMLAVVGTRKPSPQGVAICEELMDGLKGYDVVVVSGLAYGIDAAAHRQCVKSGIETIGVLGHGLSKIYPAQHRNLAKQMLEKGGLLTEYTHQEEPDREHFPARNRIIAGLCDALVVVETPESGGSMISAHMALDYNKEVFAVPGRPKDERSKGCNGLIKRQKAQLIESAEDLIYSMNWEKEDSTKTIQRQLFVELNEQEQAIINLLKKEESLSIDHIAYRTNLKSSGLAALLLGLEFKGAVRMLPGKQYISLL